MAPHLLRGLSGLALLAFAGAPSGALAQPASASAPPSIDCSAELADDELSACEQRALADAERRYRSQEAACEAALPPFLRDQLAESEAAWQQNREIECPPGDGAARCLASALRERTNSIARTYPECALGSGVPDDLEREGPLPGGPRSGMLPARWTPPRGESQAVPFSFESQGRDTGQGTMHTTLGAGGERFEGDYLRIQKSTKGELVTAMSISWSGPEWELWKHNADGSWTEEGVSVGEFARFYTGKLIATLQGDRGHSMRCQLSLKDAEGGLLAGGKGHCQVTDGGTIDLEF
jgi:hypothetical protein